MNSEHPSFYSTQSKKKRSVEQCGLDEESKEKRVDKIYILPDSGPVKPDSVRNGDIFRFEKTIQEASKK